MAGFLFYKLNFRENYEKHKSYNNFFKGQYLL